MCTRQNNRYYRFGNYILKIGSNFFSLKVLSTLNFLAYFFSLKMKNENFASRNCSDKNYQQIKNFVMLNITIWSSRVF